MAEQKREESARTDWSKTLKRAGLILAESNRTDEVHYFRCASADSKRAFFVERWHDRSRLGLNVELALSRPPNPFSNDGECFQVLGCLTQLLPAHVRPRFDVGVSGSTSLRLAAEISSADPTATELREVKEELEHLAAALPSDWRDAEMVVRQIAENLGYRQQVKGQGRPSEVAVPIHDGGGDGE